MMATVNATEKDQRRIASSSVTKKYLSASLYRLDCFRSKGWRAQRRFAQKLCAEDKVD